MIVFTKHARARMIQRGISAEKILRLIRNPDEMQESFKERLMARKQFAQRTLEAVYRKSGDNIIIITCYWVKEG